MYKPLYIFDKEILNFDEVERAKQLDIAYNEKNELQHEHYHENSKYLKQYFYDKSVLNSDEVERAKQLDIASQKRMRGSSSATTKTQKYSRNTIMTNHY